MNSRSQVQELSINSNTDIECSILSRSSGNVQLAIIWYFSPISTNASWLKILEVDKTNVIKTGDEFHTPWRKQKFHTEKVSQDLFQLHILNVEDSDQGKYHCAVEEWLLSTNGTWHKLGEKKSGLTELKLKPTGKPCRCILTMSVCLMAVFSWAALLWSDYVGVKIWPKVIGTVSTYKWLQDWVVHQRRGGHLRWFNLRFWGAEVEARSLWLVRFSAWQPSLCSYPGYGISRSL